MASAYFTLPKKQASNPRQPRLLETFRPQYDRPTLNRTFRDSTDHEHLPITKSEVEGGKKLDKHNEQCCNRQPKPPK